MARFRLGDRTRLLPLVRVGSRQLPLLEGGGERLGGAEVQHGEGHEGVRVPVAGRAGPLEVPVYTDAVALGQPSGVRATSMHAFSLGPG